MTLLPATDAHLRELMGWFPDRESAVRWGGPDLAFPFTAASFRRDVHWGELPSYALVEAGGAEEPAILAFGQYYPRAGRCHLARLAVAPGHRGRGLGARLVRELAAVGCRELGASECSLFVLAENAPAAGLYRKLGFAQAPLPEGAPDLPGCLFMIAPEEALRPGPE